MPIVHRFATKPSIDRRDFGELERMAKYGVGAKELSATKKLLGNPAAINLAYRSGTPNSKSKRASDAPELRIYNDIFLEAVAKIAELKMTRAKPNNDKATRLIYILALANETFGDRKLAREFMCVAIRNSKPLLLQSSKPSGVGGKLKTFSTRWSTACHTNRG